MNRGEPYEILADRYDAVMSHVDYPGWAALVERIWERIDAVPTRILETGAGTCRLAPFLVREGRNLVSTDLSLPMLARGFARNPRRACCDFRHLPFRDEVFDSILCLYDAVNYCATLADLDAFFAQARRVLVPGGVLVFDATTSRNSRLHFADVVFHDRVGGSDVVRHSWYDDVERIQHNDFTFFVPRKGGGYNRLQESHAQRVWARSVFRSSAARSGLEMIGCWNDDLDPADPSTLRLHMACRKPVATFPVS